MRSRSAKPVGTPVIASPFSARSVSFSSAWPRSGEHFALGVVECLLDVVGFAVGELGDFGCGTDQSTQSRGVVHDPCVLLGARDSRNGVLDREQRVHAADRVEQTRLAQCVGDRHRIDGLTARVQRANCVEDVSMCGLVELVRANTTLDGDSDRIARQEHRTEERCLGIQVVGRDALQRTSVVARVSR